MTSATTKDPRLKAEDDKRAKTFSQPAQPKAAINKELEAVVAGLQKQYANTRAFQGDFVQTYHMRATRKKQTNSGKVFYRRPGLMRWDYAKPNEKQFIINGNTLWYYKVSDKQAFVDRCFKRDTLTSSLSFLLGQGSIKKDFNVTWFKGTFGEKTDHHLALTPKFKNSLFVRLILVVNPKNFQVQQSIVVDHLGNVNQFAYSSLRFNTALSDNLFRFTQPKGIALNPMPQSCIKSTPIVKKAAPKVIKKAPKAPVLIKSKK